MPVGLTGVNHPAFQQQISTTVETTKTKVQSTDIFINAETGMKTKVQSTELL